MGEAERGSSAAVGRVLRACRLDQGLTQEELAEKAGLSVRAIRDLERGRAVPRRSTVERLAHALKLDQGMRNRLDALVRASRALRQAAEPDPRQAPAAASDHATAWQIPWALLPYFDLRKAWDEWLLTHEIGLAAARESGDLFGEAAMLTGLGNVQLEQCDLAGAISRYRSALKIDRVLGDRHGEGIVLNNLAEAHCELGAFDRALEYASAGLVANHETGYRRMEAWVLCHLARALAATGSFDDVIGRFCEAIDISSVVGDLQAEAYAFDCLGRIPRGVVAIGHP